MSPRRWRLPRSIAFVLAAAALLGPAQALAQLRSLAQAPGASQLDIDEAFTQRYAAGTRLGFRSIERAFALHQLEGFLVRPENGRAAPEHLEYLLPAFGLAPNSSLAITWRIAPEGRHALRICAVHQAERFATVRGFLQGAQRAGAQVASPEDCIPGAHPVSGLPALVAVSKTVRIAQAPQSAPESSPEEEGDGASGPAGTEAQPPGEPPPDEACTLPPGLVDNPGQGNGRGSGNGNGNGRGSGNGNGNGNGACAPDASKGPPPWARAHVQSAAAERGGGWGAAARWPGRDRAPEQLEESTPAP